MENGPSTQQRKQNGKRPLRGTPKGLGIRVHSAYWSMVRFWLGASVQPLSSFRDTYSTFQGSISALARKNLGQCKKQYRQQETTTANNKLMLDYVYEHETSLRDTVYLTQPVGGGKTIDITSC
jgi:hypothetical protein